MFSNVYITGAKSLLKKRGIILRLIFYFSPNWKFTLLLIPDSVQDITPLNCRHVHTLWKEIFRSISVREFSSSKRERLSWVDTFIMSRQVCQLLYDFIFLQFFSLKYDISIEWPFSIRSYNIQYLSIIRVSALVSRVLLCTITNKYIINVFKALE